MTEIPDIDNPLRTAMNAAWVDLMRIADAHPPPTPIVSRREAEEYLIDRMRHIGSWPDSPGPEKFPFIQPSGSQEAE